MGMVVIDDVAEMTKEMWIYLDTVVKGKVMDIVDDLRKDPYEEERQYKREARLELGKNLLRKNAQEAYTAKATLDSEREANKILTDEIERLRKALRLARDRIEPLASFQQKDIGSSTIRVGEETKFSRDARSFNGEK